MIKPTPQEAGRVYERQLCDRYGAKPQPNSGATPRFKLDCKLGALLLSAKHTIHESYRLTAKELLEALAGAQGPGGRGEIPAMAIRMQGFPDDVLVLRASDLMAVLDGEVKVEFAPSKRQLKLAAAAPRTQGGDHLGG